MRTTCYKKITLSTYAVVPEQPPHPSPRTQIYCFCMRAGAGWKLSLQPPSYLWTPPRPTSHEHITLHLTAARHKHQYDGTLARDVRELPLAPQISHLKNTRIKQWRWDCRLSRQCVRILLSSWMQRRVCGRHWPTFQGHVIPNASIITENCVLSWHVVRFYSVPTNECRNSAFKIP